MSYDRLKQEMEKQHISIRQLAIKAGIVPQSLYAVFKGRVKFWPGWKMRVAEALEVDVNELFPEWHETVEDAPSITVYEEIKQMDKNSLAKWILKLIHEGPDYLAEAYCRLLCEYRKTPSMCAIPEEDDCPTKNDKISDFEIIIALLDSEA